MKKLFLLFVSLSVFAVNSHGQQKAVSPQQISKAVYFDIVGPLKDFPPVTKEELEEMEDYGGNERNKDLKKRFYPYQSIALPIGPDAVWQKEMGTKVSSKGPILSINGQSSNSIPPDCNGDVGPNHFFQGVNSKYAIYDKSGNQVVSPTAYNSLFQGVPGASNNDGDPIILYDSEADRWMAAEFSGAYSNPDYMLIAVSTTGDPTGTWYRWSFVMTGFPDYMKFGVWQDGYYMATNTYYGNDVYVFERDVMIAGGSDPQMVGFNNPWRPGTVDNFHCIQPLDNDGVFAPAGSPALFITMNDDAMGGGNDELWVYELDTDWGTPSNSTFDRVQQIAVSSFDSNFGNSWNNITQPGTSQKLDAVPGVLMYRAVYRNFGSSQAIVCCHTVDLDASNHAGIRWYELEMDGSDWGVRQQGTYGPDQHSRWMGSIAINSAHEIAIGYSISSSTEYPGVRYTGQSAAENALATGILDISEVNVATGGGSQNSYNRWGDYSLLSVDPTDDQTFWFTTQYINLSGAKKTRICAFDFEAIQPPAVNAGDDDNVCVSTLFFTDATASYYASAQWETSGDGQFQNGDQIDAKYLRGNGDIENGTVTLTLTVQGFEPGQEVSDEMVLTIIGETEAFAGNDTTIHYNLALNLNAHAENFSSVLWTSSGDGFFTNGALVGATYYAGTNDISAGEVTLTLTSYPLSPCEDDDSDNIHVIIDPTTGVFEYFTSETFAIVPNPTTGKFKLISKYENQGDVLMVTVRDINGRVVVKEIQLEKLNEFDLSFLEKGVYYVEIKNTTERIVKKVVLL